MRINQQIRLWFLILILMFASLISSCVGVRLKPVTQNDSLQTLSANNLNKLNGDYEIISVDSSFRTLSHILAYYNKFNFENLPKTNDRINLLLINPSHLKVTLYKDNRVIKTKVLEGQLSQNYFLFKATHIRLFLLLNAYAKQIGRIGLLNSGDLTVDTDDKGLVNLVVIPIFGGGAELYNLIFKRIN